jgi:hypothetical protein
MSAPSPWVEAAFLVGNREGPVRVDGWTYRGLGLAVTPENASIVTLTHVQSGLAVMFFDASMADVVPVATAIAELTDRWVRPADAIDGKALGPQVIALADESGLRWFRSPDEPAEARAMARRVAASLAAKAHMQ